MEKYKIIEDEFIDFYGRKLYRIIRIVDNVKGGFIESIGNLSQDGNAWVYGDAKVSGDAKVFSISAASIVAKVARDRQMPQLAERYPAYGLARNMGYGTAEHIQAIKRFGPCAEHRRTFIGKWIQDTGEARQ